MKKGIVLILIMLISLLIIPVKNASAASISEIKVQVSSYISQGEIWDAEFGSALLSILNDAQYSLNIGDLTGKDAHLNAFVTTLEGGSGALLSVSAALALISMAQ